MPFRFKEDNMTVPVTTGCVDSSGRMVWETHEFPTRKAALAFITNFNSMYEEIALRGVRRSAIIRNPITTENQCLNHV